MKSRILAAALLAATLLVSCSDKKVYLFNGKNMDGWKVVLKEEADAFSGASTFSVENEMIHITGQPFGYARTEKKYSNYSLHLEWRWAGPKGVDGGVFNYLQDGDKVWPQGVQLQMTPKDMGMLMGGIPIEGVEGPFYRKERIVAESPEKPVGEWNEMEFLCKDGQIKCWLNGVLINEAVCDVTDGYIAVQSEGGSMDFRNIYLSFPK
ncbi:MAG: DUF1080 domain-containing protein [Bacteroidales bacterium]|nr:DUF1080 domain-containing protein [Bacteroidales bacterium]